MVKAAPAASDRRKSPVGTFPTKHPRCAHGYLVLEESIVSYKCAEKFYGEFDDGIMWNDPDIGVDWGLERIGGIDNLIVADKDKNLQSFAEFMEKYGGLK